MKLGPVITAVVAVGSMLAVLSAFSSSASPYVTIKEARTTSGDRLHLAGDLVKDSTRADVMKRRLTFRLRDAAGDEVTVEHTGEMPSNLAEATKIVAVGGMNGDHFESSQLIVKCPSRYDPTEDKAAKDKAGKK